MKFIFTLLLIITTSAIVNAQCNYTLILGDSYGDGWNGGQMILVQNGNTIASLNGPNPSPNFTANDTTIIVAVTPGVPVDLIWNVAGNWPSEMSVTLLDENGMSVYSMPNNSELLALTTLSTSTPTCANCNAVPSPGNTISSNGLSLCPGAQTNLTLQNATLGSGVTYQWYVSSDGINYNPIIGANSPSYSLTASVEQYYFCSVTCSGFTSTNSNPSHITIAPFTQCYCVPSYFNGTDSGDLISNVEIEGTTLSNNTGFVAGTPSYTFFTGQPNYTATLIPSNSYNLNIATGEWGNQGYAAWIDYNDDGLFDISERIGYTLGTIGDGLTTGQINDSSSFIISLACSPASGTHRLRIRGAFNVNGDQIDPCLNYGFGETEDYEITIAPPPACPSAGLVINYTATETTATVTWELGCSSATNFNIEYGPAGFTQGTGTLLLNQTVSITNNQASFSVTGLVGTTTYDFYYQAVCGPNTSAWSATSQFTTACSVVTGLGWCEGFDDVSPTEQCWTVLNLNNDFSSWDMNTQFDQLDGNNCASINTDFNNGNNEDWLISPQLSLTGTEILTFNYKVLSDLEPNNLKVKLSTTGNSPADFTQTLLSLDTITNTLYQDTSVNLGSFTGNVYIAFHIPQGGLDGWVLYLDQICIQECVPASIQNDSIEICQSADSLDLTTVLNIGQSIGQWSFNSQPNNLNGSMLQLNGLTTGIYQANYLVNNACQSTSASAYISLYEVSNAGIDSSVVLCKNQPFNLFDALGGSFQIEGTWYDPSNQQLQGSSIVSSNFPGQYNYDYIITNGVCPSDTSNALIIVDDCIFSSVEEINPQSITLYPNPTDGLLSLSMSNECESCILEVTDIDGRVVYMDKIQNTVNGNLIINLERILPGMYYLNLIDANQRTVINFIKK